MNSSQQRKGALLVTKDTTSYSSPSPRCISKCDTNPDVLVGMRKDFQQQQQQRSSNNKAVTPTRRRSFHRLIKRLPSFSKPQGGEEVVVKLPEKSILSGKGSERSFIRRFSERNLVKKISQSIDQDMSTSQKNSMLDDDNDSAMSYGSRNQLVGSIGSSLTIDENSSLSTNSEGEMNGAAVPAETRQASTNAKPAPLLHRKEVVVGELLGEGAFSKVMAIKEFRLMKQEEFLKKNKNRLPKNDPRQDTPSAEDDLLLSRQEFAAQLPSSSNKNDTQSSSSCQTSRFVIKHLNRKLLRKPKEFQQAAVDLIQEAEMLASTIDCDYILNLRAMSMGGLAALKSGRFNDLFLVLDRLHDTLDTRIDRWRKEGIATSSPTTRKHFFDSVTHHALELASALEYLHERRIVFRDTKPQNVGFLSLGPTTDGGNYHKNERVQLFDFGLARYLPTSSESDDNDDNDDAKTYPLSMAGTLRYMSPEMLQEKEYNCKTDVYSFALTFYEMLSLRKPYGEILKSNQFQEFICVLGKRPYIGDLALPPIIEQLLQDSWCSSIPDRLSIKQVRHILENFLDQTSDAGDGAGDGDGCPPEASSPRLEGCFPNEKVAAKVLQQNSTITLDLSPSNLKNCMASASETHEQNLSQLIEDHMMKVQTDRTRDIQKIAGLEERLNSLHSKVGWLEARMDTLRTCLSNVLAYLDELEKDWEGLV